MPLPTHPQRCCDPASLFVSFPLPQDLSARELFAKQLMVLAGVSADRAFAIVERFPTPEILMRKYDELSTAKEREEMLKDLKCGISQRKLGLVISKMISQLYCQKGPLK